MQAAVVFKWGGPEVLEYVEVPDPVPRTGEVIVELMASSVNYHDILVRSHGRGLPLPSILGIDGVGRRRDTGEEVIILPALYWGDRDDCFGDDFQVLGDATDGTYSELIRVPSENLFPKPQSLSWEEAAALPVAGLTAYRALFTRGRLRAGESVIVLGAGSGVSTFAVSLAVAAGAQVYVTSSSPEKIVRSQELGATGGVLYTDAGWTEELRNQTRGGADLVIDGVGSALDESLRCLRRGGRVVVFGATGGSTASLSVPSLYFGQYSILGTTSGNGREFAELIKSVDRDRWRPVVDSTRPLAEVGAAHARMEERAHFGKMVLLNR